ncbi:hypothetical protein PYW08_005106 [Mythimna loreyi]|uniref:Uncharacterized protein n=1 Tax=Mythimna loreyi TaxID=667449 RepID=A0ACC2QE72_9NEOP|nr:hypothetical protein PYW08_005106 [Mythimna loreyi]
MADSAKTPKNFNSPKSGTTTELELHEEQKGKPPKEIPLIHDEGFFQHDTGDTYDGEFEAKKKDHSVKMNGQGVYTTAEGDSYTGQWEADKLVATGVTVISYNDGAKFEGLIKDWCYSGHSKYTYPDGSMLTGDFSENCPVGHLVLTDPNGHIWLGKAELGYGWFEPVNHFYEMLETTQTRVKRRHKNISNAEVQAAISRSDKLSPTSKESSPRKPSVTIKDSPTSKTSPHGKSSPDKSSPSLKTSPGKASSRKTSPSLKDPASSPSPTKPKGK